MGVKDLWALLSPICEKKSLWELQGQTVAIDLSCWICDSQKQCTPVLRPYMRNLFFRTTCLLMLGIRPIFVLEGDAPSIKQKEIRRRIDAVSNGDTKNGTIKRSRLNTTIVQCQKMLEILGVSSIRSPGEAEAMCARLNDMMVVDGCISQDSDCFLYGAKVVYRNFSAACSSKGTGFSVDLYDMERINDVLGLDREGLVALALLCGCDYQENSDDQGRGVAGIGMDTASQLVIGLSKMFGSVLTRIKSWRSDTYYSKLEEEVVAVESGTTCIQCGHRGSLGRHDRVGCKGCDDTEGCKVKCAISRENSLLHMPKKKRKLLMLELRVRSKAIAHPGFPSQAIIDEFLAPVPHPIQLKPSDISWDPPHLSSFLDLAETYLGWQRDYSLAKFLPLITRWKVMHGGKALQPYDVHPVSIKKERIAKGVPSFEVNWNIIPSVMETQEFSTLEPISLFEKAYYTLAQEFLNNKEKKCKKPKSGADKKTNIRNKSCNLCRCQGSLNKGHICQFLDKKSVVCDKGGDTKCDEISSAINGVTKSLEHVSIQNLTLSSVDSDCMPETDDDFDALELSAIINGIVGGKCASSGKKHSGIDGKNELAVSSEHKLDSLKALSSELSGEYSKRFTAVELDNMVQLSHSKVEYCAEEEGDRTEISSDIKMLCTQLENVNLVKVIRNNESMGDTSDDLATKTSQEDGQFLAPNFDLGTSVLLLSPDTTNRSK